MRWTEETWVASDEELAICPPARRGTRGARLSTRRAVGRHAGAGEGSAVMLATADLRRRKWGCVRARGGARHTTLQRRRAPTRARTHGPGPPTADGVRRRAVGGGSAAKVESASSSAGVRGWWHRAERGPKRAWRLSRSPPTPTRHPRPLATTSTTSRPRVQKEHPPTSSIRQLGKEKRGRL